jgi:hypothetical protein
MKITTKYSANPTSGAGRITAKCNGRQLTVAYDHELSASANHATAAAMLASKLRLATEQQTWQIERHVQSTCTFSRCNESAPAAAADAFRLAGHEWFLL